MDIAARSPGLNLRGTAWAVAVAMGYVTLSLAITKLIAVTTGTTRGLGFFFPVLVLIAAKVNGRVVGLWTAAISTIAFHYAVVPLADDISDINGVLATLACMIAIAYYAVEPITLVERKPADGLGWLPFVSDTSDGRDFWDVEATGNYLTDIDRGVAVARSCIAECQRSGSTHAYVWAVRDMVKKGRFSGVEVGFLSEAARLLKDISPASLVDDDAGNPGLGARVVNGNGGVEPPAIRHQ